MTGKIKEGTGYVEEEVGEIVGSGNMARKGRALRNQGKMEQGKRPKTTPLPLND